MQNKPKNMHRTRIAALVAGFAVAATLGSLMWQSVDAAAIITPVAEHYTELSFSQRLPLPSVVTQKPIPFSFSIHNVEGQFVSYPYTVALKLPSGSVTQLASGTVPLAEGYSSTVPESITLPKGTGTSEILVILPDQRQEIHFWLRATQ